MKKLIILFMASLALCVQVAAQHPSEAPQASSGQKGRGGNPNVHRVNFGVKGGFTSSLFMPTSFSIGGERISEVQNIYKIGYFGSFFTRINFKKHFIQPEISYVINRCNLTFYKPQADGTSADADPEEAAVNSSIASFDLPVLYGYNVVKSGPYNLAILGGPKLRYIWQKHCDIDFQNFDQADVNEELHPFAMSLTVGVAVTISPIFFDFRYDVGLTNLTDVVTYSGEGQPINYHRRDHVLSFSLGFFF